MIFKKNKKNLIVLFCLLLLSAAIPAKAQQTNIQLLVPPPLTVSTEPLREISLGYFSMRGAGAEITGIDLNTAFGTKDSKTVWGSGTIGTALFGTIGSGETYLNSIKKHIVGTSIHACASLNYSPDSNGSSRWILSGSVPFSVGSFDIGNTKKQMVSFYNFLSGIQASSAFNLKSGNYLLIPSLTFSLMSGYTEKYQGGVYWDNLKSGGVKPFVIMNIGLDLAHLIKEIKLGIAYQRFFDSRDNKAMDLVTARFTLGWNGWGRRLRKEEKQKK